MLSPVKCYICLLLLSSVVMKSQQNVKVKREDNRFLFFQTGTQKDTIITQRSDLFRIHFPDSIKEYVIIHIQNAQFQKSKGDSLFRLMYIPGMKYSLSKPDTAYIPLVEGICEPSKQIRIDIKNMKTNKTMLQNTFIVK